MKPLLEIKNLDVAYSKNKIIENLNFNINENEIISIVGESGSGKSTLIRAILNIISNGGLISKGEILFLGKNISSLSEKEIQKIRGEEIGIIFQDTGATMNPIKTIEKQFLEYILTHNKISKKEASEIIKENLLKVNSNDTERVMNSYPFELSGGMKQRVAIAMILSQKPKLILADEPTSALDVTVQSQIIKELKRINKEYGVSILLVTHNIGVASYISDRIAVMKNGEIVEFDSKENVIKNSKSEYTKKLLNSLIKLK